MSSYIGLRKSFTAIVEEDPETGDLYIPLPEELLKELGWEPKDSNVKMLAQAYKWYVDHYDEISKSEGTTHRKAPAMKILKLMRFLP